jgi:glycerophosphoryl diester phosphodiesterase
LTFKDYPYFRDGDFLPFAHRGGSRRFPENTRASFEGAMALGFRHIETDVHLSADGHLVVFHDSTVDRTTDGQGAVASMTLAELRKLDVGYRFSPGDGSFPYRGRGLSVMTLEEAFLISPDLYFNVEMKGSALPVVDALNAFISAHGVRDRVLAAAADDRLTKRFRAICGERVPTSPGAAGIARFWAAARVGAHRRFRFPFQALQVPIHHGVLQVVTPEFVEAAHEVGIAVHVWTIDDPTQMRWLRELDVDGIMTDCPEVLQQTVCA